MGVGGDMDSSAGPAHVLGPSYRLQEEPSPTPEPDTGFSQFIQCSYPPLELPAQGDENPISTHQPSSEPQETIVYVQLALFFLIIAYYGQWNFGTRRSRVLLAGRRP